MEAVVQILEAEDLASVMYIPSEMRHSRLEVTLRPVMETAAETVQTTHINKEIMQKFRKAAESGEAAKRLKQKLAEGARFDFDVVKLLSGTMTEDDWQNLYTLQKQAWSAAAGKTGHA
jgi:hypothetical protein